MKLAKTHESSLNGHGKAINAISWNCDGKKLATGSSDQTARVWTVDSHKEGRELVLEDHKEGVEGLSWSPTNSDVLATASSDKIVRLWDIRAKKSFKIDAEDDVLNVSFSPDGTMLMISDKACLLAHLSLSENVRLIDIRSNKNKTLANLSFDKEYWVNELVWHGNNCVLMCAGRQKLDSQEKGEVIRVDAAQETESDRLKSVHNFVAHTANCTAIAMDRSGSHFATGAYDGSSCLWDANEIVCLRPACSSLEEGVGCLSFSHDGQILAGVADVERPSASSRKLIDLCQVSTGETIMKLETRSFARKLAWHPTQMLLAFGGEKIVQEQDRYDRNRSEVPVTIVTLQVK
ncbi:hypothetical protein GUITHDRAFT_99071 [Guillardia theta CCMP2712]|uniref:Anaphase-promoting complex subunit 4 WD40 domain-containing protein n=1 Tax=Guillardia theta (strain CCMP2712) TaxID=905079 RepID=L1K3Y4_GUITC|nr:hypothetical protein GUITHDRAFT_99071 [Guillardia theta CCMP2712]EKX55289.1 hypothetical protein GUITHDRAFT_99071 [Guillardia theta CCMP2712]|eukprot:XP_005842269.1 hypothetical protein GUITHDRAFT_99071 [Guillardia theta CCMP2712]